MRRLEGKHALVTGASSGFGRAIALMCAAEGANLALFARSEDKLQEVARLAEQEGVKAFVYAVDVSQQDEVEKGIAGVRKDLGTIDILVNNAGTNIKSRSIEETTPEEWQQLLNVNLTSAYLFTKALLSEMKSRGTGTIINIASRAASHPGLLAGVAYSSAKRGMEALTQVTNEEGNLFGVRACVINPGEGNTPIMDLRPRPPSLEQRQKMMQAEDIAEVVVMVAALPQRVNVEHIELKPTQK